MSLPEQAEETEARGRPTMPAASGQASGSASGQGQSAASGQAMGEELESENSYSYSEEIETVTRDPEERTFRDVVGMAASGHASAVAGLKVIDDEATGKNGTTARALLSYTTTAAMLSRALPKA